MKKLLLILLCLPMIGFGQGWETIFGGTYDDYGYSVQQTTDGGYIITGNTEPLGDSIFDVYLIKTDGNGVEQWNQTFAEADSNLDVGQSVQQTTDGGYIIAAYSRNDQNQPDLVIIKTDGNGVEEWNQVFSSMGYLPEVETIIQQTSDGGYIIGGIEPPQYGGISVSSCLIKTDGNGVEQWRRNFEYGVSFYSSYVQQTTDGGYIIGGHTIEGPPFIHNILLIKTDGNGDSLWTKTINDTLYNNLLMSAQQTADGGYIITGQQWPISFNGDSAIAYLIKTDGNGEAQWTQTFGGSGVSLAFSVQQTTDGGYIITGFTASDWNGDIDVYLIKTDGSGNITSTFNIPTPNSNRKLEKVVDILGKETKPQPNTPFIEIYDDGTVEKRIVIE